MHILILGSGGREHALAWKIRQSPHCKKLFIAPGNAGTALDGSNVDLDLTDFEQIGRFAREQAIDMLVVGPEAPLVAGITDFFNQSPGLAHIKVIGPSATGAKLEGSKAFAKAFMQKNHIPTAGYRSFTAETLDEGLEYLKDHTLPIVLKADGLAAGKGVLICDTRSDAAREFRAMLEGKFGKASAQVVVEEYLYGLEFSVFVLTDGVHYQVLPIAKDYKRIGEHNTGLNTGGMGSVSPVSFVDETLMQRVRERIIDRTIAGIRDASMDYKGVIFFGLINLKGDPYVIEYNCRFGDPETQVVLPRLKNDLVELFKSMHDGTLPEKTIETDPRFVTAVVLVSGGYPGSYTKGKAIHHAVTHDPDSILFHAGTKKEEETIVTNGGRVMAVSSYGDTMDASLAKSNALAEKIRFDGKYYRTDIGFDL